MCGLKLSCSAVCWEWYRRVLLFLPFVKSRSNTSVTFQLKLKQCSAIHQHFSRGLKDQHLGLPAQHDHSSFAIPFTRFIVHAWRLLTVLRSGWCRYVIRRGLRNQARVCQPICAARPGPALWPSVCVCVCVCVPHVPPVQWFTVSVLGHMTENRWRSGVPPHPQHTHIKKQIIHTHTSAWTQRTHSTCNGAEALMLTHKCTTHTLTDCCCYTPSQTECALLKTWLWLTLVEA